MKKLIAIVACLALVGSFSIAACAEAVSVGSAVDGMTTMYDAETGCFTTTVNANVGDQATILAFTGETLRTDNGTNIEFINQEAKGETTFFTYKMKSDVVEGAVYTVKIGGSDVEIPYSQKITIPTSSQEPTTYTVSGTVANAADTYTADDIGDEDLANEVNEAFKTTVTLFTKSNFDNYVYNVYGEDDSYSYEIVSTTVVDGTSKTYSFADLAAGEYVVAIERAAALPCFKAVAVSDSDVTISSTTLRLGELYEDFGIDGSDINEILPNLNKSYGDDGYSYYQDLYVDFGIDGSDINEILPNLNKGLSDYEGGIDIYAYFE